MAQQKCLNGFADTVTISYVHWWNSDTFNLENELLNTWISETNSDPCTSSLSSESLEDPTKIERVQFVTTSPPVFSQSFLPEKLLLTSEIHKFCPNLLLQNTGKALHQGFHLSKTRRGFNLSHDGSYTTVTPMNFNNPKAWRGSKYTCLMFWVSM